MSLVTTGSGTGHLRVCGGNCDSTPLGTDPASLSCLLEIRFLSRAVRSAAWTGAMGMRSESNGNHISKYTCVLPPRPGVHDPAPESGDPLAAGVRTQGSHVLKHLADAYQAFFQGQRAGPRCQARHRTQDGFPIADAASISHGHLRVPRIGWLRLKGANRYADCTPVQGRVRQEGIRPRPQWYAYGVHAVPAAQVRSGAPAQHRRPARQVAEKAPQHPLPRHAPGQSHRGGPGAHGDDRGAAHPGHDPVGPRHSGILARGWGQLERRLAYQWGRGARCLLPMPASPWPGCGGVDPAHRPRQSRFCCLHCGWQCHAGGNAAWHILGRGDRPVAGDTGAAARCGAGPWGPPVPRATGYARGCALGYVSPNRNPWVRRLLPAMLYYQRGKV